MSIHETQNTTIKKFQQKNLIREDQLKKCLFIFPAHQRNSKFPDPEQLGGARDGFEIFEFIFRAKFQTNGDWYFNEKRKFNYAFSRCKSFAQNQLFRNQI